LDVKQKFGKIAFIGERELAIGFKLVGIEDVFPVGNQDFQETLKMIYGSGEYGLILASNSFINSLDKRFLSLIETSVSPLVIFVPVNVLKEEETISDLARKVLGLKLNIGGI